VRLASMRVEARLVPSAKADAVVKALGALAAVLIAGLILQLSGKDAWYLGEQALDQNLGSWPQTQQMLLLTAPILMTGLAVYLCTRLRVWNIGVGGQMLMGAAAATGLGLHVDLPNGLMLVLMALAAMVAGALWMLIPALLRAYWSVNEVITTLLMSLIALRLVEYLATEAWNDPAAGIRSTPTIPYDMPLIPGTVLHIGIFAPLVVAAIMAFVLRRTTWGYEVDVMGANPEAAAAVGMPSKRRMIVVMMWSGAIAGLGGMVQLTGTLHALSADLGTDAGLYGFIVAALAAGSIVGLIVIGVLITMLLNSGIALSTEGVSQDVVVALYGFILLLGGLGQVASRKRIVRRTHAPSPARPDGDPPEPVGATSVAATSTERSA
jgi:general nucleoside transport system permease protein